MLNERPPDGYTWSGERITRKPETQGEAKMGNRETSSRQCQNYVESVSLTLRTWSSGENIKNARRKLETPMAPAMTCTTCKKNKHGETRSKTNDFKSNFVCILEGCESTRMRMEESLLKYHEDHIAGRGDKFTATLQFVT